jgi:hypothetical protein
MPSDKYRLPEVDPLKDIGFIFEYGKLDEVIPYLRSFVNANIDSLISHYFRDQYVYDEDGNTVGMKIWADPNTFDDELYEGPEKELIEQIIRIEKGDIKYMDHALLVHPKYRNDKKVILKALNRKLRTLYGATGDLIYRRGIWDLKFDVCVKECLYHRVLDAIIFKIATEGKIEPEEWNPQYLKYRDEKTKAEKYKETNPGKNKSLSVLSYYWEADKELMTLSNEMFSSNLTLEKNARIMMRKALMKGVIVSDLEKKEKTISYYLRLQAKIVNASKDNNKSNKGIQEMKRQSVIELYNADPEKSILQIVSELPSDIKVTRKTVSKYIKEYQMGKNNRLETTI